MAGTEESVWLGTDKDEEVEPVPEWHPEPSEKEWHPEPTEEEE